MNPILKYLIAVRAPFFTASIVPVILGSVIAWTESGNFDWGFFGLTLLAGILIHAGTNLANDYFDHKSRCDESNQEYLTPFTGGSRVIQKNILGAKGVLTFAWICFSLSGLIGIYLALQVGWQILILGLIGFFCGFFYTAPPIFLVSRGIGEIVVGLNFGILMTQGAYFVQTGRFSWEAGLASLPVALLITAVLYINEFPDYQADRDTHKNHLVIRWGRKKAVVGYVLLVSLSYALVVIGVVFRTLPYWSLLVFLTFPLGWKAIRTAQIYFDRPQQLIIANANTIKVHLGTGLLLSVGYIISKLV